jgi:hypothetical protein
LDVTPQTCGCLVVRRLAVHKNFFGLERAHRTRRKNKEKRGGHSPILRIWGDSTAFNQFNEPAGSEC